MTSEDKNPIAAQLLDISDDAAAIVQGALVQLAPLVERAAALRSQTADENTQLRHFLDQFALETGSGPGMAIRLGSEVITDVEKMRADVAQMAVNESQASLVAESLTTLGSVLESACGHFDSPSVLARTFDPTGGFVQASVNRAREDELKRMSREIHDGPAQVLANAIYQVQNIQQVVKRTPESIPEELTRLLDILKEGVTEVRRFMFDLEPTGFEHYGLGPTIERYVNMFGALRGQKWICTIEGQLPELTPDQTLVVFRIIQESLHNAQKHAGVDATVEVNIRSIAGTLQVVIRDNGIGFDAALVAPKMLSGRGMGGMRDRAAGVHAHLLIESQPGHGTTVTLIMPVDPQDDAGVCAVA